MYKTKVYDLPDCKASSLGEYLTNLLDMQPNERIIHIVTAKDYTGYMVFAFENGKIARVQMSAYATKTNRKKLVNAYSERSPLVSMHWVPDGADLYLQRGKDKAMVVNVDIIPSNTSKTSGGVSVFTLRQNTRLTAMRPVDPEADDLDYYRTDKIPTAGHFLQKQLTL